MVRVYGLYCSSACGIFPDQGLNPHFLIGRWILYHWPPGKPHVFRADGRQWEESSPTSRWLTQEA